MKNNKIKNIVSEVDSEIYHEVKEVCIESLLKKLLNIHLEKPVFNQVVEWCGGDVKKAEKAARYANITGRESVIQLTKG